MSETASNCRTSTSFTTMPPVLTDSQKGSVEDIQISLAPYIQSYLSQTGRRHSCCRVMLPVTFERAAPRSWLNPRFDSPVLEGQYQASVFPQLRLKFRFALFYILLCSLVWLLYFLLDGGPTTYTPLTVSIGLIFVFALLGLWVTGTDIYRAYTNLLSGCCALLLCMFSLALLLLTREALSPLGHFSICIEIVMLVYTIIPLPLWLCCTISVLYSICFEVLSFLQQTRFDYNSRPAGTTARNSGDATEYYFSAGSDEPVPGPSSHGEPTADSDDDTFLYKIILIRVLIQLCVHLIGVQILIMTVVRMRGTFMKVGQNLLVRRQLEMEKQLKEKMIHSMMPPKVADLLLKESRGTTGKAAGGGSSFDQYSTATAATSRRGTPSDLKSLFRPFHMNRMENVSILFADIVGFTRMSASKTAEQLVEILNDLFERFDDLCLVNGCEKISTLGDCYYCVSGCPEPRPDHAICCVEMGLGMIESIRVFDAQRNEGIKMRVGVHTGTVLCGIVGTKRVKFDVWSNDVTLANRMESSGKPDQVHVSEETCGFLSDAYVIEEGEEVDGHRTYFVVGKKVGEEPGSSLIEPNIGLHHRHLFAATTLDEALTGGNDHAGGNSCLLHSATNVSSIEPVVPPASPAGPVSFASLQASPVTNTRPPLASLTKMTKFLRSAVKGGGDGGRQPIGDTTPAAPIERESLEKPRIIISTKSISDEFYTGGEEEQQHHFDRHTSAIHGSARELCSIDQQSTGNHSPHSPAASSISRLQRSTRQDDDGDWQSTTTGQQLGESTHHTTSSFRSCWKVSNLLKKRHDSLSNAADLEGGSRNCDSVKCREEEVPCIGSPLVEPGTEQRTTQDSGDIGNINQTNITSRQGCYQTVPILIVTPRPTNHPLDDGHRQQTSGATGNGASCSSAAGGDGCDDGSMFIDEIIDVRSYISQSRSDISPFARTGSYRSQATDRSSIIHELARGATGTLIGGNGGGTTSHGRPRSSTISAATASWGEMEGTWQTGPPQHARHASVAACSSARLLGPDGASLSPSATSRKDSGIRSNSRRSSIQHQIMLMNQSAALSMHRVSGYFTSSQSSLSGAMVTGMELEQMGRPTTDAASHPPNGSLRGGNGTSIGAHGGSGTGKSCIGPREPHPDPLAACLQQLRKQSDLQLIRCVRDNARSQRSYLVKPPLLPVSLCFKSRLMEKEFRSKAHRFGTDESIGFGTGGMGGIGLGELEGTGPPTLATPKYNTYIDLLVSFAIYLATSTSLFLLSPSVYLESYKVWVCIFVLFSTVQLFALFICTKQVCRRTRKPSVRRSRPITSRSCYDCLLQLASHWYPWHLCGGILMSLPVISILSNFAMMDVTKFRVFEFHYGFLMYICIVHFCNFTQLNWGMRNCMALATAVAFIGIAIGHMVQLSALEMQVGDKGSSLNVAQNGSLGNSDGQEALGRMLHQAQFEWFNNYRVEIYVDLFLLLVLVWFLNREFEIGYRLSFHGSAVASQDKVRVQNMKNQADMLLHNIIPKHVAEQLKNTAKYSENHHDIGIIFASIINFNEMYDESYLGGKEYLRVLNELIADFDELLARPEFRCVEKIKTIGSTFMAASGLDPSCRGENYEHLYALVDFALAMQQVVESFNRDLLEFNLIMRVGYNFGDVTAGVIGTSKLYYDIWGDAVNVASRMDSTGVAGRIQVGSDCVPVLNERYDFEPRGKVYVKGKDHMEVYLLVRKKPDLLGPPELDIDPL